MTSDLVSRKTQHNIFVYDNIKVFFKHTDYYGFVHIYYYLEWMSYAREAFFNKLFPQFSEKMTNFSVVTVNVSYDHFLDSKFGDNVKVVIYTKRVRKLSFDVIYEFYNQKNTEKIGLGKQTLVFLDKATGRPVLIPEKLYIEVKKGERIADESD